MEFFNDTQPSNRYIFDPAKDITVFELATCTPMIAASTWWGKVSHPDFMDDYFKELTPNAQRHWRIEPME